MNYRERYAELVEGNEKYAKRNKNIVATKKNLLGVRMPDLRKLAKELVGGMSVEDLREFMGRIDSGLYEDVMLAGMMVDYARLGDAERIALMREYLHMVDSWALIDSVTQKRKKFDREMWWKFVDECLASPDEFVVRYGVVFMMSNFLDELTEVFARAQRVKHEGYYVKMALAWMYAEAALKDYDVTMREMRSAKVDKWVRRKALTKMLESYRITDEQRVEIRELRSKIKA